MIQEVKIICEEESKEMEMERSKWPWSDEVEGL
jgi:hypothetical protein